MGGDYILRVRLNFYDNPTNQCPLCRNGPGCCDRLSSTMCIANERCDNQFLFCVRPLGTPRPLLADIQSARDLQCLQTSTVYQSEINFNGAAINFTEPMFLGLPNPLEFSVNDSDWEVSMEFFNGVFTVN